MSNFYDTFHRKSVATRGIISKSNFTYYYFLRVLKDAINISNKNVQILDIGCGIGTIDLYLANMGFYVTGIDISKKAIQIAKKNSLTSNLKKFLSYYVKDIQSTVTKKNKYEIIICSEVLEHTKNDKSIIKKLKVSLKKNGILIISVPSINAPLYKLGKLTQFDKEVGHLRRYSAWDLESLLTSEKFKIITIKKTEGLIRNLLFTNNKLSFIIKFIKGPLVYIFHLIDRLSIFLFGESQLFIVAKK
jgi:2-polyprenyl-3-methyl-5-hydroxy-6-metoxy-1,4-benzoquinol methylase